MTGTSNCMQTNVRRAGAAALWVDMVVLSPPCVHFAVTYSAVVKVSSLMCKGCGIVPL